MKHLCAVLLLVSACASHAATQYLQDTSGNWSSPIFRNALNGSKTNWVSGNDLYIYGSSANRTLTGNLATTVNNMYMNGSGTFTYSNDVTLTDNAGLDWSSYNSDLQVNLGGTGVFNATSGTFSLNGSGVAHAKLTVNMTGGTWNFIGARSGSSSGSVTFNLGGGVLNLSGGFAMSSTATVNLSGAAMLITSGFSNPGTLNLNGGTLRAATGSTYLISSTVSSVGTTGTTTMDNNGQDVVIAKTIGGTGALIFTGGGAVTLGTSNTFSGGLTISSGTVLLGGYGDDQLSDGAPVIIHSATLALNGKAETIGTLSGNGGTISGYDGSALSVIQNADETFGGTIAGNVSLTKLGSGMLTLAGTNGFEGTVTVNAGTLALASNPCLSSAVTLVINDGGNVSLAAGIHQTVEQLALGGQWMAEGTYGSTASAAAYRDDAYFAGAGILTVIHSNGAPATTPSPVFDWFVRSAPQSGTNYAGRIFYAPHINHDYATLHPYNTQAYHQAYSNGWPVAFMLRDDTGPVSGGAKTNTLMDTLNYISSQGERLDYAFEDFENTNAMADTLSMIAQVQAHPDPDINSARLVSYSDFPGASDPSQIWPASVDRSAADAFYRTSGLNVANPNAYPYEYMEVHTWTSQWGNQVAPNKRSALFWAPLERVSVAKRNLPPGHQLIPWLTDFVAWSGYDAPEPTREDHVAMIAHVRLRGADGYYGLTGLAGKLYGWTDLDWLFHGTGRAHILNLATDKRSGVQWSGYRKGVNHAFFLSNLSSNACSVSLPACPGLPLASPVIPAGTHLAMDYINDPASVATNTIYLGRDAIDHGLFMNNAGTLSNAIVVADPRTTSNGVARVTIGSDLNGSLAAVFAGDLALSNRVTLQGLGAGVTFAGSVSGAGGITTTGLVAFTGSHTGTGATTVAGGTLLLQGSLAGPVEVLDGATLAGDGMVSNRASFADGSRYRARLPGGPLNVRGRLDLGATLDVVDAGGFTTNTYVLFACGGALATNGFAIGDVPNPDSFACALDTNTPGLVQLAVTLTPFGAWQTQHFGGVTNAAAAPDADPDGDGQRNGAEFTAGTDPTNALSRLAILGAKPGAAGNVLSWAGVTGRLYTVQRSTNLPSGFSGILSNLPWADPLNTVTDSFPGTPVYYRIGVSAAP